MNEDDFLKQEAVKKKYAEEGIALKNIDIYRKGLEVLMSNPVEIEY